MPYIRTLNAQNIVDEMEKFVLAAMGITSLIFFLFFDLSGQQYFDDSGAFWGSMGIRDTRFIWLRNYRINCFNSPLIM